MQPEAIAAWSSVVQTAGAFVAIGVSIHLARSSERRAGEAERAAAEREHLAEQAATRRAEAAERSAEARIRVEELRRYNEPILLALALARNGLAGWELLRSNAERWLKEGSNSSMPVRSSTLWAGVELFHRRIDGVMDRIEDVEVVGALTKLKSVLFLPKPDVAPLNADHIRIRSGDIIADAGKLIDGIEARLRRLDGPPENPRDAGAVSP